MGISDDFKMCLSSLTVMFILILALHAAVRPYKHTMHNVFNAALLADIAALYSSLNLNQPLHEYHLWHTPHDQRIPVPCI